VGLSQGFFSLVVSFSSPALFFTVVLRRFLILSGQIRSLLLDLMLAMLVVNVPIGPLITGCPEWFDCLVVRSQNGNNFPFRVPVLSMLCRL
jgi:hypothetical protein